MPLFISRYLAVMSAEKETVHPHMKHLQDIMADAELYSWKPSRAFDAIIVTGARKRFLGRIGENQV